MGPFATWVRVLVPKTAMDKDDLSPAGEDQIGVAWQVAAMEPVAVSHPVDEPPDRHFWLHTLAADCAHVGAALEGRNPISHGAPIGFDNYSDS